MPKIFVDFDGTITSQDSIVLLTEVFGAGGEFRRRIIERLKQGEISVYEAIEKELATVTISWEEAILYLRQNVAVDPYFRSFVDWCLGRRYPVAVVSSGIRQVAGALLEGIDVPIYAHPVEFKSTGWIYRKDEECEKIKVLQEANSARLVYIGDGLSDVPAVPYADLLFAKSYLARYCEREKISYHPYNSFQDVQTQLENLL